MLYHLIFEVTFCWLHLPSVLIQGLWEASFPRSCRGRIL